MRIVIYPCAPGEGDDNPLQYSCLENPVDWGAWWAAVDGVAESWTRVKQLSMHALGFPRAQLVKKLPALRGTWVWSLGWENPLEKGKATHSSILDWRIPWTVKSMGSQSRTRLSNLQRKRKERVHWSRKWQPTPAFLPREPCGQRSLVGCRLWGQGHRSQTWLRPLSSSSLLSSFP